MRYLWLTIHDIKIDLQSLQLTSGRSVNVSKHPILAPKTNQTDWRQPFNVFRFQISFLFCFKNIYLFPSIIPRNTSATNLQTNPKSQAKVVQINFTVSISEMCKGEKFLKESECFQQIIILQRIMLLKRKHWTVNTEVYEPHTIWPICVLWKCYRNFCSSCNLGRKRIELVAVLITNTL